MERRATKQSLKQEHNLQKANLLGTIDKQHRISDSLPCGARDLQHTAAC